MFLRDTSDHPCLVSQREFTYLARATTRQNEGQGQQDCGRTRCTWPWCSACPTPHPAAHWL